MMAVSGSLEILKELSAQFPKRAYFHSFLDKKETGEDFSQETIGKLVNIGNVSIFKGGNSSHDELKVDLYSRLYNALEGGVDRLQFTPEQTGLLLRISNKIETPDIFKKTIAHFNNQWELSGEEREGAIDYFKEKVEKFNEILDLTGKYRVLEMDDGLDTIGLIVPASCIEDDAIQVGCNYRFIAKPNPFDSPFFLIAYKNNLKMVGHDKLARIRKKKTGKDKG